MKTLLELLNSLKLDIDFDCIQDIEEITSFEELKEELQNNLMLDVSVIYCSNAIEYLSKNDPSLTTSLELASDMGFESASINSEVLASLLATEELKDSFYGCSEEIEEFFNEVEL